MVSNAAAGSVRRLLSLGLMRVSFISYNSNSHHGYALREKGLSRSLNVFRQPKSHRVGLRSGVAAVASSGSGEVAQAREAAASGHAVLAV